MIKISAIALLLLTFLMSGYAAAQETIDARLVKNDPDRAKRNFTYNRNGYNYMLFELDESYDVVKKETLLQDEQKLIRPASGFKNSEGKAITQDIVVPGTFNFYEFGIKLASDQRTYIALDKETVIIFHSIREITAAFAKSPANSK